MLASSLALSTSFQTASSRNALDTCFLSAEGVILREIDSRNGQIKIAYFVTQCSNFTYMYVPVVLEMYDSKRPVKELTPLKTSPLQLSTGSLPKDRAYIQKCTATFLVSSTNAIQLHTSTGSAGLT